MRSFVFACFFTIFSINLWAQTDDQLVPSLPEDSIIANPSNNSQKDSIVSVSPLKQDSITRTPTPRPQQRTQSDIETTINYSAKDSIIFDVDNQKLYLYGKAHIDYDDMSIDSENTSIDWEEKTLSSKFLVDSTGSKYGKPVFTQKSKVYETNDLTYNFKTKRALIKGAVTESDGAFMHGEDVKKDEDDDLFIKGGKYTTCSLADPHFFIESDKIKVIPGSKVVTGPFNLKFREIPTPLWGPFGMFPQPKHQASGILFPSYGEEQRRGFFLRDMGYYFAFNDYIDLRLTGDIYSKGAHAINATSNYKKRYSYGGTFNFSYNRNISDDVENPIESKDYWIRWNHRPETRGLSSFSASVSAGTSTYNSNNNIVSQNYERSINSQFSSNVGYTQRFRNLPFNFAMNARHSQNISTKVASLTLPDFTMSMNRIYPLKKIVSNSKSPLAKLSFSHNFAAKNEITNNISSSSIGGINVVNAQPRDPDAELQDLFANLGDFLPYAKSGGRHTIPVSTSFSLLKYFTVSPSFNYQEVWYLKELDYTFVPEENGVRVDTVDGFSRAGSWNTGASMNTRLYGFVAFGGDGKIQAIRHVATPSVSFSYSPDFGSERYGVWEDVQIDTLGNTRRLSKYQNFAYGSPSGSKSKTMSFSLSNNLEMKIRDDKDSTQDYRKVKIFDNLSMSSGYNFAADSFKLSNINWNARTSFFKGAISVSFGGVFDPYVYQLLSKTTDAGGNTRVSQRRLDQYAWNHGGGIGQLSSLNTSISLRLKPKNTKGKSDTSEDPYNRADTFSDTNGFIDEKNGLTDNPYATDEELDYIMQNPEEYVDFDMPWSLNVQYSINRRKTGFDEAKLTQSMSFSGSVSLTQKTQVSFRSGYDFEAKKMTTTNINVNRDLHCWSLTFSYIPFGYYQSFSLSIRPRSALLQQLKIDKRRSFQDLFNR
ncbi:putative LPS assembly protein LptD [Marinoscillum sp. MHG1-6]|uniref:putative LPS assembly protein LptD n=1 Tax=Marinoscillum sp. MHG1-6 TaxID=2959627 RepID=UPI002157D3D4|nr:putative LPS assembly protein LptD [Marinoscillum sp. MHG1-6]